MLKIENHILETIKWTLVLFKVRFISLVKFIAFFFFISNFFLYSQISARETFEFNLGQKINILSDKAFQKTTENEFEAVGNVVITHLKNSIYGEKARINFNSGNTEVIGNVRYIAPAITLYGTKLLYNFTTRKIDLDNARLLSDNFVITGKKIIQDNSDVIKAEDAEYTTCKDCPESWSVFGKKVTIEVGKYVRIKHAYLKINGVIAMYIPYVVFPIKQKRESGVLFPVLGFNSKEGFRYQQPLYWAISDFKDLTFTPSSFGKRGVGADLQFRQNLNEKTWIELNSLQLKDKIYAPYKLNKELSGGTYFRHFSDFEMHSIYKTFLNSHLYFTNVSDLDLNRDLDFYSKNKVRGTETGGGGFFEGRFEYLSTTFEGYYNKNLLIQNPTSFDNQYVQLLPKISLNTIPYNLFHSKYLFAKNMSIGLSADYSIFKQNKFQSSTLIRNARRLNFSPYLDWQLGNLGPIFFSHKLKMDYQNYVFPHEQDKKFNKNGLIYETEAKLELDKIYGIAYNEEVSESALNFQSQFKQENLIGTLPSVVDKTRSSKFISNQSYRHSQEFKLKHYFISNQRYSGNANFKNQIETDEGQFDYLDAIREREHVSNQVTAQDSLPFSNTIEFQWNNKLIRKSARIFDPHLNGKYLKDNFDYSNIFFFDLSQGYDANIVSDRLSDHLTRLYVNTGLSVDKLNVGVQEFYFHRTSEHKLSSVFSYNFDHLTVGGKFTYNSFNSMNTPVTKLAGFGINLGLSDLVTIKTASDYNLETRMFSQNYYSFLYSPMNNCWKIELNYTKDLIETKYGLLFYINYNENNFTSISLR